MTDELLKSCGVKVVQHSHSARRSGSRLQCSWSNRSPLQPEVLADIYLGHITMWDDAHIAKDNPGAHLPNQKIIVVYRSDGSGTSFIFTDYLSKVSSEWANGPGKGTSVNWPTGVGGKGNEGVAVMCASCPVPSDMSS